MKIRLDNRIFLFLGALVDVVWISLLWYLGSVLIFTAGAASSAAYYTVHMRIFKGEGYIFPTFRNAFMDNFKRATLAWILCLILDIFLTVDFLLSGMAVEQGSALGVFYYPVLVCMALALMWQISVFAYQARFDDNLLNVLKMGAVTAFTNMGWMVFLEAVLVGAVILARYLVFIVVMFPGAYACLTHHVFEHIYKKNGWVKEDASNGGTSF